MNCRNSIHTHKHTHTHTNIDRYRWIARDRLIEIDREVNTRSFASLPVSLNLKKFLDFFGARVVGNAAVLRVHERCVCMCVCVCARWGGNYGYPGNAAVLRVHERCGAGRWQEIRRRQWR